MSKRTKIIILASVAAILLLCYYLLDPAQFPWTPKCVFHELTGWECPGCGSQRMLHALLHGNIAEAWHYNALFLLLIPFLIPMVYIELNREKYPRTYAAVNSLVVIIPLALIIVGWGIVRNL